MLSQEGPLSFHGILRLNCQGKVRPLAGEVVLIRQNVSAKRFGQCLKSKNQKVPQGGQCPELAIMHLLHLVHQGPVGDVQEDRYWHELDEKMSECLHSVICSHFQICKWCGFFVNNILFRQSPVVLEREAAVFRHLPTRDRKLWERWVLQFYNDVTACTGEMWDQVTVNIPNSMFSNH